MIHTILESIGWIVVALIFLRGLLEIIGDLL